jgi:hypothetical protein
MSLKRKAGDIAADAVKKPKQNASITSFFGAPKPSPNASKPTSDPTAPATLPTKFDKDAWVAGLSDEHKELLKLEIDTLHESWLGALKDEVTSESFLNLKRFLKKESEGTEKIFPPWEDVYSWYEIHSSASGLATMLTVHQVTTHAPANREGRHSRTRSLPQSQPSTRPLLLRPPAHTRSSLPAEHLQVPQKGLPVLHSSAQELRPSHTMV